MKTSRTGSESKTPAVALRRRAERIAWEKAFRIPENMESLSIEAARPMLHELRVHQIELEMQNEELRRAQAELDAARARYFNLYDMAPVGYCTLSEQGLILEANLTAATLLGVARGALVKQPLTRFILPEDQDIYYRHHKQLFESGEPQACELRIVKMDGTAFWVHLAATAAQDAGGTPVCRTVMSDITERKRAEEALRESEEWYRSLYFESRDAIMMLSPDRGFLAGNPAAIKLFAFRDEKDFTAQAPASLSPEYQPDGVRSVDNSMEMMQLALEKGSHYFEWTYRRADGIDFLATVLLSRIENGSTRLLQATVRDITDRKHAEETLKESEKKYRLLADHVNDVIFVLDMNLNYTYISPSVKILRGYKPEEVLKTPSMEMLMPSSRDLVIRTLSEVMELEKSEHRDINISRTLQLEMIRKDGTTVWTEVKVSFIRDETQRIAGILGVTRDITERKRAKEELNQSEERYRSIFENAQEGIYRSTPGGRIIMANPAMAKIFGYASPEELMSGITDVARQLYVDPEERAKIRQIIEEQGLVNNYETQFYRKDGSIIWVSMTTRAVRDEKGQILYYEGIDEDITDRKQSVERIRKALAATVHAIAVTVETRDSYTAGHQRRVADLARSIATEMNLPIDIIDGIRMAAAIHDLGKISVPAEILSKPTKLTAIEFSLIKTHSQSGYDILKDIDFPWPVARTVLEHHERMNGSGYPNGLTGDNMLLESRILAVADVVESMASHRPYRPSLGIDAAMKEIESNRGILYDINAVNACLKLFREKSYQLEGT
jgi:PAS domain S-box-containing protein